MTRRRLIEEALPLAAVNAESAREKHARRGHISAMHLWWARRPLAMCRAVTFAALVPDPGDDATRSRMLQHIALASSFEASTSSDRLAPLRAALKDAYPRRPPRVLDCFAGGGAIPLEALRLGCDVTAVELNPVAHLIEKCTLDYPQNLGQADDNAENPLARAFVEWAAWLEARVSPKFSAVFAQQGHHRRPSVYYWARTMLCGNPACRAVIPLLSSCWLSKSTRRTAWFELLPTGSDVVITLRTDRVPATVDPSIGTVKASSVTCPNCHTSMAARDVRDYGNRTGFGHRLMAVSDIHGQVRSYRVPTDNEVLSATVVASSLIDGLSQTAEGLSPFPDEECDPNGFRRVQSLVFGFKTWRSLFNDRQLYVLSHLCEGVREAFQTMLDEGLDEAFAKAVATYLALCVDRIVDRNSTFCTADVTMEAVRNTFPQQAIRMTWDYTEVDPFAGGPGSWTGSVAWIEAAIRHCSTVSAHGANVLHGNAQQLPFADGSFDAVIVDPPYYDAIQYSYLSDFFYVWLKRSVGALYPSLFATPATPKKSEVIQNQAKRTSADYVSGRSSIGALSALLTRYAALWTLTVSLPSFSRTLM